MALFSMIKETENMLIIKGRLSILLYIYVYTQHKLLKVTSSKHHNHLKSM